MPYLKLPAVKAFIWVLLSCCVLPTQELTFELPGLGSPCSAQVTDQQEHVDLVCRAPSGVLSTSCPAHTPISTKWIYLSSQLRAEELSYRENKYSIFNNNGESEDDPSRHSVTLLRVHELTFRQDEGLYSCQFYCNGTNLIHSANIELCVRHGATGLVLCPTAPHSFGCSQLNRNGVCNSICHHESDFFDIGDCWTTLPSANSSCSGRCRGILGPVNCHRPCPPAQRLVGTGSAIVLIVQDSSMQVAMGTAASVSLRTPVSVQKVVPWDISSSQNLHLTYFNKSYFIGRENTSAFAVHLALEPSLCVNSKYCWTQGSYAAKYLTREVIQENAFKSSQMFLLGIAYVSFQYAACPTNYSGELSPTAAVLPPDTQTPVHSSMVIIVGACLGACALLILLAGLAGLYILSKRQKSLPARLNGNASAQRPLNGKTSQKYDAIGVNDNNSNSNLPNGNASFLQVGGSDLTDAAADARRFASIRKGFPRNRKSLHEDAFILPPSDDHRNSQELSRDGSVSKSTDRMSSVDGHRNSVAASALSSCGRATSPTALFDTMNNSFVTTAAGPVSQSTSNSSSLVKPRRSIASPPEGCSSVGGSSVTSSDFITDSSAIVNGNQYDGSGPSTYIPLKTFPCVKPVSTSDASSIIKNMRHQDLPQCGSTMC